MVAFNIPAVCPTCRAVFPSGFVLGEGGQASIDNCGAGPCPNGHMGVILDGTYSAIDGLYRFFMSPEGRPAVQKIYEVVRDVAAQEKTPDAGLTEIASFMPSDLGAAVKKLGSKNPLTAFLVLLAMISSLALIGSNVATIYKTLSPNAPTPPTIILNGNPTIINQSASGNGSNQAVSQGVTRQQRRQQERQGKAQQQRGRPAGKEAPEETGSIGARPLKLKARHIRKRAIAERRREFSTRHTLNPTCDKSN